jgi:alpha-amylase
MPTVCLCFQVHQPYRLRPFSYFEIGRSQDFWNTSLNRDLMVRVAQRCYEPAVAVLDRVFDAVGQRFSCTFSLTGTAYEQMREYAPTALAAFKKLGCRAGVEFLGETYYHSLASFHENAESEFGRQVGMHRQLIEREFGKSPRVFRNTELLYDDRIGATIASLGYDAVCVEGISGMTGYREDRCVYRGAGSSLRLLARNRHLSDEIAFRFCRSGAQGGVLTPTDFVSRLTHGVEDDDAVFMLYLDFETFGEHLSESSGILRFLQDFPQLLLEESGWRFVTPSELIQQRCEAPDLTYPRTTSWADASQDTSPWLGNSMQQKVFSTLYAEGVSDKLVPEVWGRLQTSDHLYYLSTKGGADGQVHQHFSPFESPYEAFIAYMNVLQATQTDVDKAQLAAGA